MPYNILSSAFTATDAAPRSKKKKYIRWAPNCTRACNVYDDRNGLKKRVARVGKAVRCCTMLFYDAEIGADIIAS